MTKNGSDRAWLVIQAQDLLYELRRRQFLLECLDRAMSDVYFDADPEAKEGIENISTVLAAYDNEKAVNLISQALQLLEDARK